MAQLDAETNQLRAAMFSSVTHDLRTPLASIKAGVTSLLDPSVEYDTVQETELLTTILEETDRLNRLVGNILDLARIRAGALSPVRSDSSLDETLEAVVARMRPRIDHVTVDLTHQRRHARRAGRRRADGPGAHEPAGERGALCTRRLHGARSRPRWSVTGRRFA